MFEKRNYKCVDEKYFKARAVSDLRSAAAAVPDLRDLPTAGALPTGPRLPAGRGLPAAGDLPAGVSLPRRGDLPPGRGLSAGSRLNVRKHFFSALKTKQQCFGRYESKQTQK